MSSGDKQAIVVENQNRTQYQTIDRPIQSQEQKARNLSQQNSMQQQLTHNSTSGYRKPPIYNMHYAGIGNLYPTLEDGMDKVNSKFHAKLIQKKSEQERLMLERRLKKLEQESKKAEKNIQKTLQMTMYAENVNKRRLDDMKARDQQMQDKRNKQNSDMMKAKQEREDNKRKIQEKKYQVYNRNMSSRLDYKKSINQMFEQYQNVAANDFNNTSERTANIYRWKMEARSKERKDRQIYQQRVRNSCIDQANERLQISEAHQKRIKDLETREQNLIDHLQKTINKQDHLLKNLSTKSKTLGHNLSPRVQLGERSRYAEEMQLTQHSPSKHPVYGGKLRLRKSKRRNNKSSVQSGTADRTYMTITHHHPNTDSITDTNFNQSHQNQDSRNQHYSEDPAYKTTFQHKRSQ